MNSGFWNKVNSWYENIGDKVKKLAKWMFVVQAVVFLIGGLVLFIIGITHKSWDYYEGDYSDPIWEMVIGGLVLMIVAPILSFLSSWILYAFGHLVQTTEDNYKLNARQSCAAPKKSESQIRSDSERLKKIETLRSSGMISEEEYLDAVAKINNGGA